MADIFDSIDTKEPDIFDKVEPTFMESVKAGVGNAAGSVTKAVSGLAQAAVETIGPLTTGFGRTAERIIPSLQNIIPPPKQEEMVEKIKSASEKWVANIDAYWKVHPDEYYAVKSSGALPVAEELVKNPGKLVGGVIESVPLMIEGYLGTVTGGTAGGVVAMTIPIAAEEYAEARNEGTPVMPALIRAISSGVGQGILEEWSLGKKIGIAKMIPKSSVGKLSWEGVKAYARGYAQEGSQQFWSNLNKWLFTDRRQDWFENVAKSAEMGGPLELAMSAGFAGMGKVGQQHKPAEQIKRLDVIEQTVKEHPEFKPEQVQEISDEIKTQKEAVIQEYVEQVQERFPQEVKDQKSLEEVGNAIAADFGVKTDKPIKWEWKISRGKRQLGLHTYNEKENQHGIIIRKLPGHEDQLLIKKAMVYQIKETITHELGHIAVPPKTLSSGRRQVHTPEFKRWVAEHEKLLTEVVKVPKEQLADEVAKEISSDVIKTTSGTMSVKVGGKYLTAEEIKNIGRKGVTVKQANEWLKKQSYEGPAYRVETGTETHPEAKTAADVIRFEQDELGNDLGVSPEKMKELEQRPASDIVWVVRKKSEAKHYGEDISDYSNIVKGGEIISEIGPDGVLVLKSTKPVGEALATSKLSRKKLLGFIHKIPLQILGWTDAQYRDKIKELTGKRSAKDLSLEELQMVYDHFKSLYGGDVTLSPEDYEKPIPFMGKTTTMSAIIADVANVVDKLPSQVKIPDKIRQRVFGRGLEKGLEKLRAVFIGIDNSRPSRLAKLLGGGKDSVLTNIFRNELIENGSEKFSSFQSSFYQGFQKFLKDNGITSDILSKYSRAMHRWWMPVEMVKEYMGKGPDLISVTLNGKQYELTKDGLLNLYMQFRQEAGKTYATKEGFKINDTYTGALKDAEKDFNTIEQLVKSDPVLSKLMDYWYNVADKFYFKPNINNTSQLLINKDIATETENYYPLSPEKIERTSKKTGFAFKEPPKRFNLLEDQGFLNPRKGPRGPLEIGSFFQDVADMAEGVAEYSAYAPTLRIARTVLSHAPTVKAWREKGYNNIYDNLLKIIKNETDVSTSKGWLEQLILSVTRGTTRAIFSLPNIRTPAIQISSTAMFAKDFDADYLATGLKNAVSSKMDKFLNDIPWAWSRYYMDKGPRMIGGVAETAGLSLPMQGKLSASQANGILLKKADLKPFHVLYEAIRAEYLDAQAGKLKPGSLAEKYWHDKNVSYGIDTNDGLNAIRKRFTEGRRGQQSYDKFDRSVATSSHATLNKIFYLFRSFQEGAMNAQQEAYDDYANSDKTAYDKQVFARKTGAIMSSYVSEAIIRDSITWAEAGLISATARALGAGGQPPEGSKWYEWALHALLGPLDMIPLVGNYIQGIIKRFASTIAHDKPIYVGRIAEPLPLQIINTTAKAPDNFAQSIAFFLNGEPDKGKKSLGQAISAVYEGIAAPAGVPVYEIKKIKRLIEGEEETQTLRRRRGRR